MAENISADVNELHCAYHLNGQNWSNGLSVVDKAVYDDRVDKLQKKPAELESRKAQAEKMAEEFLKWAQRHGYSGTIASLIDQIKKRGGGLSNTRILISELVGKSAENEWNPKTVRALFQSLYLGRDNYFDCFNHEPIINVPGYCLSEKTLVSNKTLNFITKNFQIGVLTGRPSYEANMFLDTIGLKTEEKCILTMETSSQKKPEPGGLISIAKQLNSSNIAFVGDSIDDIQTVVNAKKIDNSRNYFSIGVLTGGISGANGERLLKNSGADEVISSINDLPNILSNSLI